MATTARLVVQMTPQEKSELEARAREAGVSTAEFVRQRLGTEDEAEDDEIETLLAALETGAPVARESLDAALATLISTINAVDALKRKA